MTDILLIYPFFKERFDRSPFRLPPLGIGYIASLLKKNGFTVKIVDCTFRRKGEVIQEIKDLRPEIIGIYSMYSMEKKSLELAKRVRSKAELLVAGGPMPTVDPSIFLDAFDVVVIGEAEQTMVNLTKRFLNSDDIKAVSNIAFKNNGRIHFTTERPPIKDLNSLPFPARELFDNDAYKEYTKRIFGYTITSMISTRGCPFECDFCSRPIFGENFRTRSPESIVDEMESIAGLGYEGVWFADDCFTINKSRIMHICDEILSRGVHLRWQCLSRVDTLDFEMALKMREAGCHRIYFGLESGDDSILKIMMKEADVHSAENAVHAAHKAGLETGAFFIIGYPGESDQSILNTIRFATALPLDYSSFTLPYPIPGTGLYKKVKGHLKQSHKQRFKMIHHDLFFTSQFTEFKLKFGIVKAAIQFRIKHYLGEYGYMVLGKPFEKTTDVLFKALR